MSIRAGAGRGTSSEPAGWRGPARTAGLCLAVAAAVLAVSGSALGSRGAGAGVLHACYSAKTGALRLVPAGQACKPGEKAVSWNVAGNPGTPGPPGPTGPAGSGGLDGVANFAEFSNTPVQDQEITPGGELPFAQAGPTSGTTIVRDACTVTEFDLADPGTYEVSFHVPLADAGQLGLAVNGTLLGYTVIGAAASSGEISGDDLIHTSGPAATLAVVNPATGSGHIAITDFLQAVIDDFFPETSDQLDATVVIKELAVDPQAGQHQGAVMHRVYGPSRQREAATGC